MRDRYEEFVIKGAGVAAIGMGWPALAAAFKEEFDIPFRVLLDHERRSYAAVGIRRGSLTDVVGPKVWLPWLKIMAGGKRQALPKVDHMQLGGSLIVAPGGTVLFHHAAESAADNVAIDDLLRALP